jgi:hypothetical protein
VRVAIVTMSPAGDWTPVFPGSRPARWVALVWTSNGLRVLSEGVVTPAERAWLAGWLSAFRPSRPELAASYVYLGLAERWTTTAPDGVTRPGGVIGAGSGEGFGAPPNAIANNIQAIIDAAIDLLAG